MMWLRLNVREGLLQSYLLQHPVQHPAGNLEFGKLSVKVLLDE